MVFTQQVPTSVHLLRIAQKPPQDTWRDSFQATENKTCMLTSQLEKLLGITVVYIHGKTDYSDLVRVFIKKNDKMFKNDKMNQFE